MDRFDPAGPTPAGHGEPAIEARGLTRYFGDKAALWNLTFRVPRGSVFAFLGRNGTGKTTTIRMLLGLLEPTRGWSTILGHKSIGLPPAVRARIGYMAEGHPVYGWMRVSQWGAFQRGFYPRWNQEVFAAVVDYFSVDPRTRAGSSGTWSSRASGAVAGGRGGRSPAGAAA